MSVSGHSAPHITPLGAVLVLLGVLAPLEAQRPDRSQGSGRAWSRSPSRHSRNHESVKKAFRDVVAGARRSTVRLFADGKQLVLGTIVDADGHVVTKASELPEAGISCRLGDGKSLPARVIGIHQKNDLAMLQIQLDGKDEELVPVVWSKDVGCRPGSWLATPGQGGLPLAIGVMSAQVHNRRDRRDPNRAFLGVRTDPQEREVRLTEVIAGSAADAAGLKRDDVVLAFDDTEIRSRQHFITSIGRRKPGDKVKIKVRREDREVVLKATLRKNDDRRGPRSSQEPLWGPLSDVRIGFAEVIQHDSVLRPNQCGGPLVNLDGRAVGINIARVGRMETLALTGRIVRSLLADLKSGKLAPKKKHEKKHEKKQQ